MTAVEPSSAKPIQEAIAVPARSPRSFEQQKSYRGIALVVSATCMFALNDAANKFLVAEYAVPAVAAVRYIIHCLLMVAILGPTRGKDLVTTNRTGLVILRALCLVISTLFLGLALQRMPVAETTAIIYLSPVLVAICARPLLNERIGAFGWLSAVLGFAGVVLIVRPGGGLDPIGIALALANVGFTVSYYLLSRILSVTETTLAMLFYTAVVGAICFGVALPWFWFGSAPSSFELILFLSLGATAGLGHYFFTAAYRYAEASTLAPVTYTHLLWAGLLGWLAFGHVPQPLSIAGMSTIALAGILVAFGSRRSSSSPG